MIIYRAPIWYQHLTKASIKKLDSLQHQFLKLAICAYNTTSISITHALARTPLLSDYIQSLISPGFKIPDQNTFLELSNSTFGQFFSNHGRFLEYLYRFTLTEIDLCPCGNDSQSALHLLTSCSMTKHLRTCQITNLVQLVSSPTNFQKFNILCKDIYFVLKKHSNLIDLCIIFIFTKSKYGLWCNALE